MFTNAATHTIPAPLSPAQHSGVHVATNAKAFRRMTPGSAKRRARIFVGIMVVFSALGLTLARFVNGILGYLFNFLIMATVIVVYLVGSCRLQAVIEVQMASASAGLSSGGGASASGVTSIRNRAVNSTTSWMSKQTSGGGGNKRHKHLQTILQAARGVVACCAGFLIGTIVSAFFDHGLLRGILGFLGFHSTIWTSFVLIRYYRIAILSGATKRNTTDAKTTKTGGTISNTSVVPVSGGLATTDA